MRRGLLILAVLVAALAGCTANADPNPTAGTEVALPVGDCGTLSDAVAGEFVPTVDPAPTKVPVTFPGSSGRIWYVAAELADNTTAVWVEIGSSTRPSADDALVAANVVALAHSSVKDGTISPYNFSDTDPAAIAALKCLAAAPTLAPDND
jgi:hypothetical protein